MITVMSFTHLANTGSSVYAGAPHGPGRDISLQKCKLAVYTLKFAFTRERPRRSKRETGSRGLRARATEGSICSQQVAPMRRPKLILETLGTPRLRAPKPQLQSRCTHTPKVNWGGAVALGKSRLVTRRPSSASLSSAALCVENSARIVRLPPHGHRSTSFPNVC